MKKQILAAAGIITFLLQLTCSKDSNPIQTGNELTPLPKKEWTFLLYDDADFEGGYDPLTDFSACVSSGEQINYLVFRDGSNTVKANYYMIDENHNPVNLKDIGEVNMGDKSTLENFMNFAKKYYPAERYIIAFYDHGGGWQGACWDGSNNDDNLTPAEINNVFTNYGGVDLVLFTAPCLMGSIESAYQLRNSVKYYVGSEDVSGFVFWQSMLDQFDKYLKENIKCTNEDIAKEIISLHDKCKYYNGYGNSITMSAVKTSKLGDLVTSFDKVVNYCMAHQDKFQAAINRNIKTSNYIYYDFFGLLKALSENEPDSVFVKQVNETAGLFNECVIAECHGKSIIGSYGLNIYLPRAKYGTEIYFPPCGVGLDFKTDTSWDELLTALLDKKPVSENGIMKSLFKFNGKTPR